MTCLRQAWMTVSLTTAVLLFVISSPSAAPLLDRWDFRDPPPDRTFSSDTPGSSSTLQAPPGSVHHPGFDLRFGRGTTVEIAADPTLIFIDNIDHAGTKTLTVFVDYHLPAGILLPSPIVTGSDNVDFTMVGAPAHGDPDANGWRTFQASYTRATCPDSETVAIRRGGAFTLFLDFVRTDTDCLRRVPEPPPVLLLGIGLLGLLALIRRGREATWPQFRP